MHPGWVPIFNTGGLDKIVLDCSAAPHSPSPLRQVDCTGIGSPGFAAPFSPSLGEYIARAVRALAAGRYRFDADGASWVPTTWASVPAGKRF